MNIRTIILSVVLVVIFLLTAGKVASKTKIVSDTSSQASNAAVQAPPADLNAPSSRFSYRSQFGECFDVPIGDLVTCRDAKRMPVPSYRSPVDECYDVSIRELASCRNANDVPAP